MSHTAATLAVPLGDGLVARYTPGTVTLAALTGDARRSYDVLGTVAVAGPPSIEELERIGAALATLRTLAA